MGMIERDAFEMQHPILCAVGNLVIWGAAIAALVSLVAWAIN